MICNGHRELSLLWVEQLVPRNEQQMCNNFIKLQRYRQKPRSKFCNTVSFVCNIRSVWLDLINTFIHISLYALCVLLMLLYTIVYWLSFRYMSSYKSIGKQAILVEYILHQYGISVAESQKFLPAKHTKWQEARINGCFRRLIPRHTNFIHPATWNLSQSPATGKWLPTQGQENISRTKSFS